MKIPRDVSGEQLSRLLRKYGYEVTRQTGSHIRLTTSQNGEHHITIPDHNPLKVGTLNAVIAAIADHLQKTKTQVLEELFG